MPIVDNIDYSAQGGYNALDFVQLGGVFVTPAGLGPSLGKLGARWVMVDTSGKVLLIRGLSNVDWNKPHILGGTTQNGRSLGETVNNVKYAAGDGQLAARHRWILHTQARLRQLHFNEVIGSVPFQGDGSMLVTATDSFMAAAQLQNGVISEPIKSLLQAVPGGFGSIGSCWGDMFDPKWAQFVAATFTVWADSRIPFFQSDDGDFVSAVMNSGHQDETDGVPDPEGMGSHGAALALCAFMGPITSQPPYGRVQATRTWSVDTVFHTKVALIDYLKQKYANNIAALNAAWGSTYGSFDSMSGGWGVGNGLADEDGMRARSWFGTTFGGPLAAVNLINSTVWGPAGQTVTSSFNLGQVKAMKEDLDVFLFKILEQYYKPFRDKINAVRPNALYIGSTTISTRAPGFYAASTYCDLMVGGMHRAINTPTDVHVLDPNAKTKDDWLRTHLARDIPIIASNYTACNADGCLYYPYQPNAGDTQPINGTKLAAIIDAMMAYQDPNGIYPYVGYNKWEGYDNAAELTGWGIMSLNDNVYDGRDYRTAIPDPYNFASGLTLTAMTEDKLYGDQVGPIAAAHVRMFTTLQGGLGPQPPTANFTPTQQAGNLTVDFDDTSTGNPAPTAWLYTFFATNGTTVLGTATTPDASFTYPAIGTYPTSLRVTNAQGQQHTANKNVVVAQPVAGLTFVRFVHADTGANAASATATPAAITVGNLVVVNVDASIGATATIAVTDSLGNTYTPAAAVLRWNPGYGGLTSAFHSFSTVATAGGASPVVTATFTGGTTGTNGYAGVNVAEYDIVGGVTAALIASVRATPAGLIPAPGPMDSGTITASGGDTLVGFDSYDAAKPTMPAGWTSREPANNTAADLLSAPAGSSSFAPTFGGSQNWVSQILQFRVTAAAASQVLTATTQQFTPTLYPVNLNIAGTTVLTATTREFTPTLYPVNLIVQTVTFAGLFPIRVMQFRSGEVANIVVRAIVPFSERDHYASPANESKHPFATPAETAALQSGEIVEELVALPNPKAILTYAQLKPLAQDAQQKFQDKVDLSVYGNMAGVDGSLTIFDGTTWT